MARSSFVRFFLFILLFNFSLICSASPDTIGITKERFKELSFKLQFGAASLSNIVEALSYTENTIELYNFIDSLYELRTDIKVQALLLQLWERDKESLPNLAWEQISTAPVRIAVANNLNRIYAKFAEDEFSDYFRTFKYDKNLFIWSESILALGFNRDVKDIPYLVEMAQSEEHIINQSGISALAFMLRDEAKLELKRLAKKYYGTARGDFIIHVLKKGYGISTQIKQDS